MTTFVKICGMTDAAAVSAAVDAGADAVGFVFFAKSPRNVAPARAAELAAAVPDGIRKVAVTLHPDPALWTSVQDILDSAAERAKGICGVIAGRAIYTGAVDLDEALRAVEALEENAS